MHKVLLLTAVVSMVVGGTVCVSAEPTLDQWWTDNVGDPSTTRQAVVNDDYPMVSTGDVTVLWLEQNASYWNFTGWYQPADPLDAGYPPTWPADYNQLFDQYGDADGTSGSPVQNTTTIPKASGHDGDLFHWYLLADTNQSTAGWEGSKGTGDLLWHGQPSLNSDDQDHLKVYKMVNLPDDGPVNGALSDYTYILFWEDLWDLGGGCEPDYNDTIIAAMDDTVSFTPEPVSLVLLSVACLGALGLRRKVRRA